MDALRRCAAMAAVLVTICGGSSALAQRRVERPQLLREGYRTENFIIFAQTRALQQRVGEAAEQYRRELADEWLGRELAPWSDICPIYVYDGRRTPASGMTTFRFNGRRQPHDWEMEVNGTQERILDSVLPHEITHTVFATHFGEPLPRWADEGACTVVEHQSERDKQYKLLLRFLTREKGIPFNRMFAMKRYPTEMLPLYAQGHSLTQFLLAQGGKRKFIEYVGRGMKTKRWSTATNEFYGYEDLSDLQLSWVQWLKDGSPTPLAERVYPAGARPAATVASVAEQTLDDSEPSGSIRQASATIESAGRPTGGSVNQAALAVFQQRDDGPLGKATNDASAANDPGVVNDATPVSSSASVASVGPREAADKDPRSSEAYSPPSRAIGSGAAYYLRRARPLRPRRLESDERTAGSPQEPGETASRDPRTSEQVASTAPVQTRRPDPIGRDREIILEWQANPRAKSPRYSPVLSDGVLRR